MGPVCQVLATWLFPIVYLCRAWFSTKCPFGVWCGTRLPGACHVAVSYWLYLPRATLGNEYAWRILWDPPVRWLPRDTFPFASFAERGCRQRYPTWQTPFPFVIRESLYFTEMHCLALSKEFVECPCFGSWQISVCLSGVRRVAFAENKARQSLCQGFSVLCRVFLVLGVGCDSSSDDTRMLLLELLAIYF